MRIKLAILDSDLIYLKSISVTGVDTEAINTVINNITSTN